MEGIMYCATIVGSSSGDGKLNALEQALLDFKQHGVDADIKSSTPNVVTLEVYVRVAELPKRFSPPPITKQTADAYERLIQKIMECGYTEIEELRDYRTGLGDSSEEIPLFEIVEATVD